MAPLASQLIQEVTAHAQSDSLEDARDICADGTYFPNNLRTYVHTYIHTYEAQWSNIPTVTVSHCLHLLTVI